LIGIGVLQLVALFSPRLKAHRYIWPALFLSAGLFLALWSDGEIWPRGNLNWAWLLQHDAEARQHKVYAVLLIAIGIIEYLRIRGSLPRFWKTWAFPALAVIGACLLLIHDHTAGSGAHSPEAQAYLVNPTLDVDGGPRKPESTVTAAASADDPHHSMQHSSGDARDGNDMESSSMAMDHSKMMMDVPAEDAVNPADHHHMMTASMLLVEREHMWFMIIQSPQNKFTVGLLTRAANESNVLMPFTTPGEIKQGRPRFWNGPCRSRRVSIPILGDYDFLSASSPGRALQFALKDST
jgi:hypothetical protein